MDVFCVRTQIFLIIILVFQRWIISAYEQVPYRAMDIFCICTHIFLMLVLVFHAGLFAHVSNLSKDMDRHVFCVRMEIFFILILVF